MRCSVLLRLISRWGHSPAAPFETIDARTHKKIPSRLLDYAMIVIDSGNRHGDSWKAIFHPKQLILNFIREDMD